MHRDVKPGNAIVSDFGIARIEADGGHRPGVFNACIPATSLRTSDGQGTQQAWTCSVLHPVRACLGQIYGIAPCQDDVQPSLHVFENVIVGDDVESSFPDGGERHFGHVGGGDSRLHCLR